MKKYIIAATLMFFGTSALAEEIYPTTTNKPISPTNSPVKDTKGVWTFSLENDFFADEDNNYTNGFRASYLSPESDVPAALINLANLLPMMNTEGNKRYGFEFGQTIFTPDDISLTNPPLTDQPYAGWLYGSAILLSDNDDTLDTFQVTLGMVGPSALGEQSQDTVHSLIDYQQPQGWDTQLKDEPGVILSYDRKYRNVFELSPFGMGFDITPSAGFNLGNIYTDASVGAVARLGRDLPSDYGPPLIRPSISGSQFFVPTKEFGWYLFGGVGARAVAQNIFLDGNTFRDSRSVDKENLVGEAQAGIAITIGDTRISYTHVLRTDQFQSQNSPDEYGAFAVSVRF
jgi:lipid A 3-O-deacylase